MILSDLYCTGQSPTKSNYLSQSVVLMLRISDLNGWYTDDHSASANFSTVQNILNILLQRILNLKYERNRTTIFQLLNNKLLLVIKCFDWDWNTLENPWWMAENYSIFFYKSVNQTEWYHCLIFEFLCRMFS